MVYQPGILKTVVKRIEWNYNDGVKEGISKWYYESGELWAEQHYSGGVLQGITYTYYKTGEVQGEWRYVDGMLQGISRTYYKTGEVEVERNFVDGKQNGTIYIYHENKKVALEAIFINDKIEGTVRLYDMAGNLRVKDEYLNDELLNRERYDYLGKFESKEELLKNYTEGGAISNETFVKDGVKQQALALLEDIDCAGKHGLAVYHPAWRAGVVGILAARLKEKYHRPVFAFAPGDNGELKGSGRSIAALHLRDALDWIDRKHPGLILNFGGHAMAAGLSIREERFAEFQAAFEELARAWLSPADLEEVIETDGELAGGELDVELVKTLENAVWGQGFPAPLFEGEFSVLKQRVVGEKHLKLEVNLQETRYDAMAFFHSDPLPARFVGIYAPMLNEFNGRLSIQLKLHYWEPLP